MKAPRSEKIRVFLVNKVLTGFYGLTLGEWLRLLRKHHFAVDPPYWTRAAFMTGAGLLNSIIGWHEDRVYGPKVKNVKIKPPLFILGHRRSGTSLLHNLLATDKQFAYPNVYQVLNPHTFLSTEKFSRFLGFMVPNTRIVDNVSFGFDVPWEEEFSTVGSLYSLFLWWVFPRWEDHYSRYLSFRGVSEEEVDSWKATLVLFLKKLTWKYDRPLVLKSPPNTCRIKLLLELFPDGRFVHIYRNPYRVFQSTQRQTVAMLRFSRLQNLDSQLVDAKIIQRYQQMYDVFFEERELIPDGQFHEIRFEDLEQDRVGQIRKLYEALNLPGFDAFQPSLQRYVDSIANYRKNKYPDLPPELRATIAQAWRRSFEEWGYTC